MKIPTMNSFNTILDTVLGGAILGTLAWIYGLGTRVSVLETKDESLVTLFNSKLDEINRRLGSIENKLEKR